MSNNIVEIFYSYQSPYSYLSLDPLYELENKFDAQFLWQPFSARAAQQPLPSSPYSPDKMSYLIEDTKRMAAERGLPIIFADGWPETEYDPDRITRAAIIASDMGMLMEFNFKVFHKWWGLGENPNEENFLASLLEELEVDLGEFLGKLSHSDTRERIKGIYKRGRKLGVFDTPTFVINGNERIYGVDRIPYLEWRLAKAGFAKKAA